MTHDSRSTRDHLSDARLRPEEGWPALLARVESQLRVVLHFRMTPAARASVSEDDLLQEVFAEFVRKIDDFEYRGPGSLARWLCGILRNKIHHAERRTARSPRVARPVEVDVESTRHPDLLNAVRASQPGVSHDARQRETVDQIRTALGELPEPLREVLLLKVYEGLSGREAAERLGIEESLVSKRYRKALDHCRTKLGELR